MGSLTFNDESRQYKLIALHSGLRVGLQVPFLHPQTHSIMEDFLLGRDGSLVRLLEPKYRRLCLLSVVR